MDDDFREIEPKRSYLKHEVPSWVESGGEHPAFFITICCRKRHVNQLALDEVWATMVEAVERRENDGTWFCPLLVAMPDHLHAVMRFEGISGMPTAIRGWKRWMASTRSIAWQRGFFDHRLRDRNAVIEKRNYILQNPVRAGLVKGIEDWKYVRDER